MQSEEYWVGYNAAANHELNYGPVPEMPDDYTPDQEADWRRGVSDGYADT